MDRFELTSERAAVGRGGGRSGVGLAAALLWAVVLGGLAAPSLSSAQPVQEGEPRYGGQPTRERQPRYDRQPRYERQATRERQAKREPRTGQLPGGVELPAWAEPSVGGSEHQGERGVRERAQTDNPGGGLPGDGDKVPLGGLEWLLAAGAGYGIWKLREDE